MKLEDAMTKVQTVVDRVEAGDVVDSEVIPKALYLFGSVLSGKNKPRDVDLLLMYEPAKEFDAERAYRAYAYGEPSATGRTIRDLRRGMKMVEIHAYTYDEYAFPAGPYELLWDANG